MDVIELTEFYANDLGKVVKKTISNSLASIIEIKRLKGIRLLGIGYAMPYLENWLGEVLSAICFMPARQGIIRWPQSDKSATALIDPSYIPVPDDSINLVIVAHGLELVQDINETIQEIWRILAPGGRAIFIVPNRKGMWARFDNTPFGYGRPFSRSQLNKYLQEAKFITGKCDYTLHFPPIEKSLILKSASLWEKFGIWCWPFFAGVIVVEAVKQIYAFQGQEPIKKLPSGLKPALMPLSGKSRKLKPYSRIINSFREI